MGKLNIVSWCPVTKIPRCSISIIKPDGHQIANMIANRLLTVQRRKLWQLSWTVWWYQSHLLESRYLVPFKCQTVHFSFLFGCEEDAVRGQALSPFKKLYSQPTLPLPPNTLLFSFFFWAILRMKLYWFSDRTVFFSSESNIFPSFFLSVLSIMSGDFFSPINSYWITIGGGISHTIVKEIVEHIHYYHDQLHHIANQFHIFAKKTIWICPCNHQESSSKIRYFFCFNATNKYHYSISRRRMLQCGYTECWFFRQKFPHDIKL